MTHACVLVNPASNEIKLMGDRIYRTIVFFFTAQLISDNRNRRKRQLSRSGEEQDMCQAQRERERGQE